MTGDHPSPHTFSGNWTTESGHPDRPATTAGRREAAGSVDGSDFDVRLTLPARPENVAVVRQALSALSQPLELPRAVSDDIRLAVTEACTNVVRHAYAEGDRDGTMDVTVRPRPDAIEVIVADAGRGPDKSLDVGGPGLGLPLIAALADTVELERIPSAGSRLTMSFRRRRGETALGPA